MQQWPYFVLDGVVRVKRGEWGSVSQEVWRAKVGFGGINGGDRRQSTFAGFYEEDSNRVMNSDESALNYAKHRGL